MSNVDESHRVIDARSAAVYDLSKLTNFWCFGMKDNRNRLLKAHRRSPLVQGSAAQ
jgi:hypothetical protein